MCSALLTPSLSTSALSLLSCLHVASVASMMWWYGIRVRATVNLRLSDRVSTCSSVRFLLLRFFTTFHVSSPVSSIRFSSICPTCVSVWPSCWNTPCLLWSCTTLLCLTPSSPVLYVLSQAQEILLEIQSSVWDHLHWAKY